MVPTVDRGRPLERPLAEATAWRVSLADAGMETSLEFEAWLGGDPLNAEAWARVQGAWRQFGDNATAPEIMAARRDAIEHARRHGQRRFATRRWPRWAPAAIAASLAVLALAPAAMWFAARPDVYETGLGERRTVMLEDGSRLALDSGTLVTVRLKRDARELELLNGQARFDVAHDPLRPFSVHAREQTIIATGTSFNVDVLGPKVMVTLLEGRVVVVHDVQQSALLSPPAARREIRSDLVPGQQLVVAGAAPPDIRPAKIDVSMAWETGQLVVDNETLTSVAQRMSRYTTHPILVDDPAIARLRLSGVFTTGDGATFVDTVTNYLPVVAEVDAAGATRLRGRQP